MSNIQDTTELVNALDKVFSNHKKTILWLSFILLLSLF